MLNKASELCMIPPLLNCLAPTILLFILCTLHIYLSLFNNIIPSRYNHPNPVYFHCFPLYFPSYSLPRPIGAHFFLN